MREIKFRFWHKKIKEYVEKSNSYSPILSIGTIESEDNIIEQFTGLKDKYGIDIYEGDIVKYYQPYAKRWDTHIVKWDEEFAAFGLFEKDNKWCKESDWMKIEDIEVLGNIHDNPELLK